MLKDSGLWAYSPVPVSAKLNLGCCVNGTMCCEADNFIVIVMFGVVDDTSVTILNTFFVLNFDVLTNKKIAVCFQLEGFDDFTIASSWERYYSEPS